EWNIIKQLQDSLKIFKTVTLEFSSNTPCPATVIPAMDKMHNKLTAATKNNDYSPAVRAALSVGRSLLNKYYLLMDDSEVYQIATVLNPKHKLKYFEKSGQNQKWIDAAEETVRDVFKHTYAEYTIHKPSMLP
ncbi:hypothetical protein P691DRAFT_614345, partial [Macrolepiota fuliginosa MF-IS2]